MLISLIDYMNSKFIGRKQSSLKPKLLHRKSTSQPNFDINGPINEQNESADSSFSSHSSDSSNTSTSSITLTAENQDDSLFDIKNLLSGQPSQNKLNLKVSAKVCLLMIQMFQS